MTTSRVFEQLAAAPSLQRPLSLGEYHRMIDVGLLDEDSHVELIEGVLVQTTPQSAPHRRIIWHLQEAFVRALPEELTVYTQLPLTLRRSEPEPDFAIVRRADAQRSDRHPRWALLVAEVAQSTLAWDRQVKSALYARAKIPEYWIVNTAERCVEVYRQPDPRTGKYRKVERVEDGGTLTPHAFKGPRISVRSLLGRPVSN